MDGVLVASCLEQSDAANFPEPRRRIGLPVYDNVQTFERLAGSTHAYLAAHHAYLNHAADARAAASEVLRVDPHFTVSRYAQLEWFKTRADLDHLADGLRKAGLPE